MSAISNNGARDILVVKIGGGSGVGLEQVCEDVAAMARQRPIVVVHGVSAAVNELSRQAGLAVRTITSPTGHISRYTDARMRPIYVQAARKVNEQAVGFLAARGVRAAGIAEIGLAIYGERKAAIRAVVDGRVRMIRDDYTGSITQVGRELLETMIACGFVPVLPPLASSEHDGELNIDGDRAAAAVAAALGAGELVILSNVRGLYRNFPDEASFVARIPRGEMEAALGWAQGRMKRKVLGVQEAIRGGVERVILGDGRVVKPVQAALGGMGTTFLR